MYWLQQLVERAHVQSVRCEPGLHERCRLDGAFERLKRPARAAELLDAQLSLVRELAARARLCRRAVCPAAHAPRRLRSSLNHLFRAWRYYSYSVPA